MTSPPGDPRRAPGPGSSTTPAHRRGHPPALPAAPARAPFLPTTPEELRARGWERPRRAARLGRRLRGSPQLRRGRDRTLAGGAGAAGGGGGAAGLALPGRRGPPRGAAALRGHHLGRHGLDGEPLHRQPAATLRRRLHARRVGRAAARPRHARLRPPGAPGLRRGRLRGGGRGRGLPAAPRPLRLLGRPGAPLAARPIPPSTSSCTGRASVRCWRSRAASPRARTPAASPTWRARRSCRATSPWPASRSGAAR